MTTFEKLFKARSKDVKNYLTDFDHDKTAIERNQGKPFLHLTRATGTHISIFYNSATYPKLGERVKYLFSATANREELLESQLETLQYYLKNDPITATYFDGKELKKIKMDQVENIFLKYRDKLLSFWETEERQAQAVNY